MTWHWWVGGLYPPPPHWWLHLATPPEGIREPLLESVEFVIRMVAVAGALAIAAFYEDHGGAGAGNARRGGASAPAASHGGDVILDRWGEAVPILRVRPAIGFRPQHVKADEGETLTSVTPPKPERPLRDNDPMEFRQRG